MTDRIGLGSLASASYGLRALGLALGALLLSPSVPSAEQGITFRDADPRTFSAARVHGWAFTPEIDIVVTDLGWSDAASGLSEAHQVAIFRSSGVRRMSTATITSNSPRRGHYRYESIVPILLDAGEEYQITGIDPAGVSDPIAAPTTPIVPGRGIRLNGARWNPGSGLVFSRWIMPNLQWAPTNFLFEPACPHPSTTCVQAKPDDHDLPAATLFDRNKGDDFFAFVKASYKALESDNDVTTILVPPGEYLITDQICSPAKKSFCNPEVRTQRERPSKYAGICDCTTRRDDDGVALGEVLTLNLYGTYRPEKGAVLRIRENVKVEFRGEVDAGPRQICEEEPTIEKKQLPGRCDFTVHLDQKIDRLYAEWWGALPGNNDEDTHAVQRALDNAARGPHLIGLAGPYRVCDLTVPSNVTWTGQGWLASGPQAGVTSYVAARDESNQACETIMRVRGTGHVLENFRVQGHQDVASRETTTCLAMRDTIWSSLRNIQVRSCKRGFALTQAKAVELQTIKASHNDTGVLIRGGTYSLTNANIERNACTGLHVQPAPDLHAALVSLINPWFEGNRIAIDYAPKDVTQGCLIAKGLYESSGGDFGDSADPPELRKTSYGVVIRGESPCATIDTPSLRLSSQDTPSPEKRRLGIVVEEGATRVDLRNVPDAEVSEDVVPGDWAAMNALVAPLPASCPTGGAGGPN